MEIPGKAHIHPKSQHQEDKGSATRKVLPFEVIFMAGGKGERLKPLTDELPKPLLPLDGKPIVRYSLERLKNAGIRDFTFVLNFMADQMAAEFGNGNKDGVSVGYVRESQPLGTIGGARLKENFKFEDVLVMNGDLLTTINFEAFYLFFLEQKADIAAAVIPYRVNLPYGIFEIGENQEVESLREKPTFSYYINAGIYLMRAEMLKMIPESQAFDAIELIELARSSGKKVSAFPLLDYWIDIGKMEDYEKAKKDIKFLNL